MGSFSGGSLAVLQIIEIAQDLACIEGSDSIQIHLEVLDQMLHDPDDLVMGLQKIGLVFLISGIRNKFIEGISQMGHAIHRREGIGILEVLVLHSDNTTDMLQFMLSPTHSTFHCNIIFMTGHSSIFLRRFYLLFVVY